jgi:predicted nucleic acid-binding Zn ribbon protein
MEIICHDCGTVFDVFAEGMSNQYVTACGECWSIELQRREIGGVFVRGAN